MEKKILEALHELEREEDVHILLATEVGSHAWGYASKTSDFDVRFIFIHPPVHYLAIDPPKEDLSLKIKDKLDFRGWELRKALRLFRKSNPSLFEALHSPVTYRKNEEFFCKMNEFKSLMVSKRTLYFHYYHMARQNLKAWESNQNPPIKLLFHCLRPILMCQWLEENQLLPPLSLTKLLTQCSPSIHPLYETVNTKRQEFGDLIEKTDPDVLALYSIIRDTFKTIEQNQIKEEEWKEESGTMNLFPNDVFNDFFRHVLRRSFPKPF